MNAQRSGLFESQYQLLLKHLGLKAFSLKPLMPSIRSRFALGRIVLVQHRVQIAAARNLTLFVRTVAASGFQAAMQRCKLATR